MKRLFYIIGHNPNTIEDIKEYLYAGANGIEPDVHFDPHFASYEYSRFYISHGEVSDVNERYTLHAFIHDLIQLQTTKKSKFPNQLALIAFDVKTDNFPVAEFVQYLEDNYMNTEVGNGVSILITRGDLDDTTFLPAYKGSNPNVCIGIDESPHPLKVINAARDAALNRVAFGYGITEIIIAGIRIPTDTVRPETYSVIAEAIGHRALNTYCSFVYQWVAMGEQEIRRYLDLHVDGLIVDINPDKDRNGVIQLQKLLKSKKYKDVYSIAKPGDMPFTQNLPCYRLCISTSRDTFGILGYGTDANITCTISGSKGTNSATIDASQYNIMEAGSVDYVVIEGVDIGTPQQLEIAIDTQGIAPDWQVKSIEIRTNTSDWYKSLTINQTLKAGTTTTISLL
ncbi:MAG: hypothetical protein K1X91_15945 [Bacteriodetes bacterium]|nr:hypothetical protein [Bacteroidota bacterium]